MKVLLAQPPLHPGSEVTPPLGLCTLASWLLHLGHDVRMIDLDLEVKTLLGQAQELYLRLFANTIMDFRPDVVGVTSMYSNSLQAERLVQITKRCDPTIVTVAGGSHFGALSDQALRRIQELDYAVEGEGELTFAALLDALDCSALVSEVPRLCYRSEGGVRVNPPGPLIDLADLPPMWTTLKDCIRLDRYASSISTQFARRVIYIEAGRGCPFACTFCATAPFWQRKYRVKPVHRIVDEIKFLHEQFGYNSFILVHDLLTANKRFVSEFCDAMLEARLPVEWMANSRIDIRLHGLLPKMKAAGCWKLFFGVESASERMQASIDKHLHMEEVLSTITSHRDHGISATCSFVIGFPSETPTELSSTVRLGGQLKLLGVETVQFHRLRLFPPSPLSRSNLSAEFDLDSLRIEYPFVYVPEQDIAAIESDPSFFMGYFAPQSESGTAAQLAQVEMFFHHAITLAPLTICALAYFAESSLVPSFYEALSECGGIARENLDWESGNLYGNWLAIHPLLNGWLSKHMRLEEWQSKIVHGLIDYEARRVKFVSGEKTVMTGTLAHGENWVAFPLTVDLAEFLERMCSKKELTTELLGPRITVLIRNTGGSFAAYTADTSLPPNLIQDNINSMGVFEEGLGSL